jgi:hypothetical protein
MEDVRGLCILIGYFVAWWFIFWFPFRRNLSAIFYAIPVALFVGYGANMMILDSMHGAETLAVALPFMIAGIVYVVCRHRERRANTEL